MWIHTLKIQLLGRFYREKVDPQVFCVVYQTMVIKLAIESQVVSKYSSKPCYGAQNFWLFKSDNYFAVIHMIDIQTNCNGAPFVNHGSYEKEKENLVYQHTWPQTFLLLISLQVLECMGDKTDSLWLSKNPPVTTCGNDLLNMIGDSRVHCFPASQAYHGSCY